ncbi:hypothetical protein ABZ816_08350 [Actinosynnema sp. NPDC047251]|uniref:hypothetical protein n=1 Tax=Saccharothrix espanaensis TaxID=103731 RepID=UPI00059C16F1|nr:hypothetical protein [Saccharothrix espanaensis]
MTGRSAVTEVLARLVLVDLVAEQEPRAARPQRHLGGSGLRGWTPQTTSGRERRPSRRGGRRRAGASSCTRARY